MCGIAGFFNIKAQNANNLSTLERMIHSLEHRGPDGYGFFQDDKIGLAHARLSIIDLEGGWQPIANEDKTIWIIFNGEIFNYPELRTWLLDRGHRFRSESDTEVIIHLYEEKGEKCVEDLNGQFAFAIYDSTAQSLFLARDRLGIRPLFYTLHRGCFFFASEIKALFSGDNTIVRHIDPQVLHEIFSCWSPVGNDTLFTGVQQLGPGHWLRIDRNGRIAQKQYWDIPFQQDHSFGVGEEELADQLRELLVDAVRLRLRADVPVGAYLSGGLDSSAITSLIHHYTNNPLKTFSVTFADHVYDERDQQNEMVRYLTTDHHAVDCSYRTISDVFQDVIWHTETAILRTAPAPLYLLSGLVRKHSYKVVLTGEGSDEILGGYDIFKEAKIRAFIAKQPDSSCRPLLLKKLYPYLALSPTRSAEFAKQFFATDMSPADELFFGHIPRWKTTSALKQFYSSEVKESIGNSRDGVMDKLTGLYGDQLQGLDYFSRTQYLEARLLLGNYLLSSQGDRMGMAHSVEGRYPFLDHRVVEFAARLPLKARMKGLNEKYLLKKAMQDILPPVIGSRKKQPYMAPDILSFFGDRTPDYVDYYLSEENIRKVGLFNPKAVVKLVNKCRKKARQGFRENMALVGILSTQILHHRFIADFRVELPDRLPNTKVVVT